MQRGAGSERLREVDDGVGAHEDERVAGVVVVRLVQELAVERTEVRASSPASRSETIVVTCDARTRPERVVDARGGTAPPRDEPRIGDRDLGGSGLELELAERVLRVGEDGAVLAAEHADPGGLEPFGERGDVVGEPRHRVQAIPEAARELGDAGALVLLGAARFDQLDDEVVGDDRERGPPLVVVGPVTWRVHLQREDGAVERLGLTEVLDDVDHVVEPSDRHVRNDRTPIVRLTQAGRHAVIGWRSTSTTAPPSSWDRSRGRDHLLHPQSVDKARCELRARPHRPHDLCRPRAERAARLGVLEPRGLGREVVPGDRPRVVGERQDVLRLEHQRSPRCRTRRREDRRRRRSSSRCRARIPRRSRW